MHGYIRTFRYVATGLMCIFAVLFTVAILWNYASYANGYADCMDSQEPNTKCILTFYINYTNGGYFRQSFPISECIGMEFKCEINHPSATLWYDEMGYDDCTWLPGNGSKVPECLCIRQGAI